MLTQSLSAYMCIGPVVSGKCCSLEGIYRRWLLLSFHLLFHIVPDLRKEGSDEDSPSRTDVPRSLTLCISIVQLWTPVLVPTYYKKMLL